MAGNLFTKKKKNTRIPPGANGYYLAIAQRIGRVKWITVLALIAVLLVCAIFAREEISVHNFQYLMKHFGVNSADSTANFSVLRYDSDATYQFGYYKDDLIIASSKGIGFYDMRGNTVLSRTHSMSNPRLVSTNRNLYVYDQGNCSYAVYDSFFSGKTTITDYPISKIAASDTGVYAVVTKSSEYRSAVYIYDRSSTERSKVLKDKLIMDVCVSSDGSRVVILSCETGQDGAFFCELQSVEPGKSEAVFTVTIPDCFPVECKYFSNGAVGVLTSDSFLTFNSRGERMEECYFDRTPTSCAFSGSYAAVSSNQSVIGVKSTVRLIADDGRIEREVGVNGQIKKMYCDNTYVYALLADAVARIERTTGQVRYEYTESNPLDFIPRGDNSMLLCYGNRTEAMPFAFTEEEAQ